jgi:hypothetical protein
MGTELPTKVMLGQKLVLMQITFLNNVRKVSRLLLSRTSCFKKRKFAVSAGPRVFVCVCVCVCVCEFISDNLNRWLNEMKTGTKSS